MTFIRKENTTKRMRWQDKLRGYLKEYESFEPTSIEPPRYFTPYKYVFPRWDLAIKVRLLF